MRVLFAVVLALLAYSTSAYLCQATGDPHYRAFSGKRFNFYRVGRFLLYSGRGVSCYTTLKRSSVWGTRSLNAYLSCRAGRSSFKVGNHYALYNGKRRNGNNFHWRHNHVRVYARVNRIPRGPLRYYLNVNLYTPTKGRGLCSGVPKNTGHKKRRAATIAGIKLAHKVCRVFPARSYARRSCFTDVSISHRRKLMGQLRRFEHRVAGSYKRVCRNGKCHYYKRTTHRRVFYTHHHRYVNRRVRVTRRVRRYKRVADHRRRRAHRRAAQIYARRVRNINKRIARVNRRIRKVAARRNKMNRRYNKHIRKVVARRNRMNRRYNNHIRKLVAYRSRLYKTRSVYSRRVRIHRHHAKHATKRVAYYKHVHHYVTRRVRVHYRRRHVRVYHRYHKIGSSL